VLRDTAPFGASLTVETAEWTLTSELSTRWARALLTLAAELTTRTPDLRAAHPLRTVVDVRLAHRIGGGVAGASVAALA
jgi:hypothetical protein